LSPDGGAPLTEAVARGYAKLLAYKDEYEVARLYTDGAFQKALEENFEGPLTLSYHMAPPLLVKNGDGRPPEKLRYGPWLRTAMKWLAHGRRLRGTRLDPFGRSAERRMERALAERYADMIAALLPRLTNDNLSNAVELARLPERIRGFGHVKLASLRVALADEARLIVSFDDAPFLARAMPDELRGAVTPGLKGIPVVTAR
jgi:indolepyruvate ferredoxin oxidoreductase